MMTLDDVSEAAGVGALPWLVKIDTDGSDFEIILGNLDVLSRSAVALYFEYDPSLSNGASGASAIAALVRSGFTLFVVFDNFGNFMDIVTENHAASFEKLETYLESCRAGGGGTNYYDVLAMRLIDQDTFDLIAATTVCPNLALDRSLKASTVLLEK